MYTIAIIPMAGSGTRFGSKKNKAFYPLSEKPIALWVLNAFQNTPEINEIIPVFKDEDFNEGLDIIEKNGITKVTKIAPGGPTRQESVYHALNLINDRAQVVVIHDGARPLVRSQLISATIKELYTDDGVICAVPVKDTIKEVKDDYVKKTLSRNILRAVQTPQTFYLKSLLEAYKKTQDLTEYTDDASILERWGGKVKVIPGDYRNLKVTTVEDIEYAEYILRREQRLQALKKDK
ncbi:MAG: 2-C-methyl-D-erythritol 4-phosphate cytidylyltransferase [Candidatus Magnetoovum sp. WYHC-5]|nr:2-C-methyl-D-erythritol 4-phosphate cytidylyltransferase [Candidatus Magnetoovum sp. WYHC-5]